MKTNVLLSLVGSLLLVGIGWSFYWLWATFGTLDTEQQREDLTQRLMQRKVVATEQVCDALAAEDLDRLQESIARLRSVSEAARWFLGDGESAALRDQYRQALNQLDAALVARDTTKLTAAYQELIISCVHCHEVATDVPIAMERLRLDEP